MKKKLALVLVMAMLVSMLTACGGNGGSGAEGKDTITVASYMAPDNLDPMYSVWGEKTTLHAIYDCLVKFDADGNIAPALAESWELADDQMSYTFKLREDVKFHDGSEFSADDVIFSLDKAIESSMNGAMLSFIGSWEKVDDYTVKINKPASYSKLLETLAEISFIVPEETYDAETFPTAPVGTGAYKFVSKAEDDSVTLEANEEYFLGAPAIKNAIVKAPLEASAAIVALETQEVDMLELVGVDQLPLIEKNEDLAYTTTDTWGMNVLMMMGDTLKNDENLRKAIFHGISTQNAIDIANDGVGTPAENMFSSRILGDLAGTVEMNTYDEALAKEYLAKSNYDGKPLQFSITADVASMAQSIQADLLKVGIELEIEQLDGNDWTTKLLNSEIELTIGAFGADIQSTEDVLNSFSQYSEAYGGNMGRTKGFDEAYDKVLAENDAEARNEHIKVCLNELYEGATVVPLYEATASFAYNKSVENTAAASGATNIFYIGDYNFAQ